MVTSSHLFGGAAAAVEPVTIGVDSRGGYYVLQGNRIADALTIGEMMEQALKLLGAIPGQRFHMHQTIADAQAARAKWDWPPVDLPSWAEPPPMPADVEAVVGMLDSWPSRLNVEGAFTAGVVGDLFRRASAMIKAQALAIAETADPLCVQPPAAPKGDDEEVIF